MVIISSIGAAERSDNQCHLDAGDCGSDGADDVHSHGHSDSGDVVENTDGRPYGDQEIDRYGWVFRLEFKMSIAVIELEITDW